MVVERKNELIQVSPGIILKKQDYSDSDEIVTVLLKEGGIRKFFVSGSKKSKKRYQGLIDHFSCLNFHYHAGSSGLSRVRLVERTSGNPPISADLRCFAFGSYLAELICDFFPEAATDHDLYDLWQHVQLKLNQNGFSLVLAIQYLLIFFQRAGYAVDVEKHPGLRASEQKLKSFLQFLMNFSEQIVQKKSRAAAFFLQVI